LELPCDPWTESFPTRYRSGMTRFLIALIGFAVLPLAAPQPASAAPIGPRGESLQSAPASEAPSQGTLTRAWSRLDQVRSVDVSGFGPVAHFEVGPEPSERPSQGTDSARFPHRATLYLLPLSRAPPA
jgi:hypothetical protein